ncbi:MAG: hypothetical protein ACKPKF_02810, partial [Microcystis panniformis]
SRASVKHPPSSLLTSDISVLALLNSRASLIGSSLLGMVRSGDINRLNPLNPYLARDLID